MVLDIGIDLGTTNTIIYIKGQGIVLNEPSVVAVNANSKKVLAVGNAAKDMLGRTPHGVIAVTPMVNSVIANFDNTVSMLKKFIKKATNNSFFKPRVMICIPTCITEVEKRAVREAAMSAGAREVHLIEEPMAAAIGAGIEVQRPHGAMIVEIGGGTSEIAVVSLGGIVVSEALSIAGNSFDNDIIQYIKKKYNITIGSITAEELKKDIASACPLKEELHKEINGRDLVTGLPKSITVSSIELRDAISESLEVMIDGIKSVLEKTPPELSSDIFESGIVLSGGGAMLKGLGRLINKNVDIPVYISENPLEGVALGEGKALNEMQVLSGILK